MFRRDYPRDPILPSSASCEACYASIAANTHASVAEPDGANISACVDLLELPKWRAPAVLRAAARFEVFVQPAAAKAPRQSQCSRLRRRVHSSIAACLNRFCCFPLSRAFRFRNRYALFSA